MMQVAVVIPYFQRQPGLLLACVRSVLAQRGVAAKQIIVVDDTSPRPADQELAELLPLHPQVSVVLQANAGPSAARNRGLDKVAPGTEIVAFLDSDDAWYPHFLADALTAFHQPNCDLFFANSSRYGADKPRFEWENLSGPQLLAIEHRAVDEGRGLHLFQGDFFDFAIHRSGIISTSTLAYRFARLPKLRFNTRLFNGQDRYFKLQLAQAARRVAFGTRVSATEGQGVNIFDSSQWGSEKGLTLLLSYIGLSKLILSTLVLTAAQRRFVQGQLAASRRNFALTSVHLWRKQGRLPPQLWRKAWTADPATLGLFLPNLLRAAAIKLRPAG
jgi:succinoglycan biosynthesis protein ExoW